MQNYTQLKPKTPLKNGHYIIKMWLAEGGYGAVYLAENTVLNGRVCILKESFDQTPDGREQFEVEATTLSNLTHPHLVRVTDNFIEPGTQKMYLAMEYIEGKDLADILKDSPAGLPVQQVLTWMDQVLDAVAYCHKYSPKVIHRDIKPTNIRIHKDDGKAVLVDFGIAKIGGITQPTRKAARGISHGHSPPEQYGTGTDTYSDVYALGATMYQLLTGRLPPESVDLVHSGAVLTPPSQFNPSIKAEIEKVILTAMELHSVDRYQTAGDMRLALKGKQPTQAVGIACPHCGVQNRAASSFCGACGKSLVPVQPLVFASGYSANTIIELVHGCDSYWEDASQLFWKGAVERWLKDMGEPQLAQAAQAAKVQHSNASAALEVFLEAAAPSRSKPILSVRPSTLDFGRTYKGDTKTLTLTIANTGRGYLHGQVTTDPTGWLTAQPGKFGCLAGQQQAILIEVRTANLSGDEQGTQYGGSISVQSNRGTKNIGVSLVVVDPPSVVVSPDRLDCGAIAFGRRKNHTLTIKNQGGGTLQATVKPLDDWILLEDYGGHSPQREQGILLALKRGHSMVITVVVDGYHLPHRGQHQGAVQIEAPNARIPVVTIPVVVAVDLPYLLDAADLTSTVSTKDDLWQWCDTNWTKALKYLAGGRLSKCLQFVGEDDLAQEAKRCQQTKDENIGLETLLRACGAPPPKKWDTNAMDVEGELGFGFLPRLWKKPDTVFFEILNKSNRGFLHGYLDPVAPWLAIPEPHFGCLPGEVAKMTIRADHKARQCKLFSLGEQLLDIVIE